MVALRKGQNWRKNCDEALDAKLGELICEAVSEEMKTVNIPGLFEAVLFYVQIDSFWELQST